LALDGGEVLDVVPGAAPEVLPEPVDQLGKVQGVERRPAVVVAVRVDRDAADSDPSVGRQREREEHRRPVGPAVRRREDPPDRAVVHGEPGQVRCVLAAPSRTHAAFWFVLVVLVAVVG
jgi:hypothetical protein